MTNHTQLKTDVLAEAGMTDRATAAAGAAAAVLPSVTSLTLARPVAGSTLDLSEYTAGCIAQVPGLNGQIAILVGDELVSVLDASPLQGLDLAATVQPAMDAAAATLGGQAEAAREMALELIVADLGGPFTAVALMGAGFAGAVLIPDSLLVDRTAAAPVAAPFTPANGVDAPLPTTGGPVRRGIEMLHGVDMELTVELGRARMTVRDLLALSPGAVLELDRAAGSPADLLVNGRLIARGEVVVVDEDFGLRITEIVDSAAG